MSIDDGFLHLIGNIVVLSSLVPLVIFTVLYGARSPWRSTTIGIGYMVQKIALMCLMLFIILSNFLPYFEGREWIRTGFYLALVITLWNDVFQLTRAQSGYAHNEKKPKK